MTARSWRSVPAAPARSASRSRLAPVLEVAVVAGAGPSVLAWADDRVWPLVVALALVGAVAVVDPRLRRWPGALALAAALGLATVPLAGAAGGAWLGAGLLLGRWAVLRLAPWRSEPTEGHDAAVGVTVLSLVAAWSVRDGALDARTAVPLVLAAALPLLVRLGDGALPRATERFGHLVGHAIGAVLFTLVGLLTVLVPWTLQRILRIDPLTTRAGWLRRRRRPLRPGEPWAIDPLLDPTPVGPRIRSTVAVVAVLAAVVAFTSPGQAIRDRFLGSSEPEPQGFRLADDPGPATDDDLPPLEHPAPDGLEDYSAPPGSFPAALDDSPWYGTPEHAAGQGILGDAWLGWRPHNPYRHLDFASRWVNIRDGARKTWAPPACDCTRLTVWVYGGSTTIGLDQRDDHTISSELARRAARDGIILDVSNRGSNGAVHWIEAHRFGLDLAVDPPPDLVLFYDGVNEGWAANNLNVRQSGDIRYTIDPTLVDIWNLSGRRSDPPDAPPGAEYVGLPDGITISQTEEARLAVDRYDRARTISRALARSAGVPVRYFWQPSRFSRDFVEEEPHWRTDSENSGRLSDQLMKTFLADDVIDLTDVFDGNTEPLFTDDVHHNEEGSRIIADAIYASIQDDLRRLVEEASQP